MPKKYQRFLKTGIDLSPLGIAPSAAAAPYFCTPRGASIFGWAGVDGIHFCFVRGWGETVFAVSPMNGAGEYVHPIARDFDDLLRLLLVCGDSAALEQAWQWDEAQFNAFLRENPPTDAQRATLEAIAARTGLAPMEAPWQYLHELQTSFDYGKLKFTEDFYDLDMNPDAPQPERPWQVFFGGQARERAGVEQQLDKRFSWAGHEWLAASVYSCAQGLVLDLFMRTEEDAFVHYLNRWAPNGEEPELVGAECMRAELDNPLTLEIKPKLTCNGKTLSMKYASTCFYTSLVEDGRDEYAREIVTRYGLDESACWTLHRLSFPWVTKRRCALRDLSLSMEHRPQTVPGEAFSLHAAGDTATLTSPVTGHSYTLTVHELEAQTLPPRAFLGDDFDCPTHFTAMTYTLSPEPDEPVSIVDAGEGDRPRRKTRPAANAPTQRCDAAAIGVIGGADGPVAMAVGGVGATQRAACSALRFSPPKRARWRADWCEAVIAPAEITLLP